MSNQLNKSFYKEVGKRIKYAIADFNSRTDIKYNQSKLANKLGLSKSKISAMVNGTRPPNIIQLVNLAKELDVSTDYLLGLKDFRFADEDTFDLDDEDLFDLYAEDPFDLW